MARFKLTLEYDGSKFAGWQRQATPAPPRTVQGEIEAAILSIFHERAAVIGAGRTDSGVHARGQVAHVTLQREAVEPDLVVRALRGVLPRDIVCKSAEVVGDEFHARYDAIRRTYSYSIVTQPNAVGRMYAWHVGRTLDFEGLNAAASIILGEHDFTAFSKENVEVKNRVCTVHESNWRRDQNTAVYTVTANRFVYSMVRALVGAQIGVAAGRWTETDFRDALASRERSKNICALAPPHGLCLEAVEY